MSELVKPHRKDAPPPPPPPDAQDEAWDRSKNSLWRLAETMYSALIAGSDLAAGSDLVDELSKTLLFISRSAFRAGWDARDSESDELRRRSRIR